MDIRISGIEWDTDGQDPADLELPTELVINTAKEGIEDPDQEVADWLSDRYGWSVIGYSIDRVSGAEFGAAKPI